MSAAGLGPDDRERLAAIRAADALSDLVAITGADSEHEAYFEAKREWRALREQELAGRPPTDGLPGASVTVEDTEFRVHGVTHADTRAEREYLREHVSGFLADGAAVYCEQGVRSMYFDDWPAVRAMDDYSWAMRERDRRRDDPAGSGSDPGDGREAPDDWDGRIAPDEGEGRAAPDDGRDRAAADESWADHGPSWAAAFDDRTESIESLASRLRDAAFAAVDAGGAVYGDEFEATLGAVASDFLSSHEDVATGDDFESFVLTRRAATDPSALPALQTYYETALLPQPLEREWLRRHDPELELLTYARNERMADYLLYHHDEESTVHAIVGAAHQPGVAYYLAAHRDGRRRLDGFAPVG